MTLRGLRQLVTLLTVVIGVVAAIAALVWLVGGTSAHRAFTLVFYAGGACLLLFALLTSGAEGRGPSDRAINPPAHWSLPPWGRWLSASCSKPCFRYRQDRPAARLI